jgi:pimeloyl-ACP methyl ester carboxylesterase
MTDTLGYKRFAVQGGDWGGITAARMGYAHADRLIGIHVNFLAVRREPDRIKNPTPEQQVFVDQLNHWLKEDAAYASIQGTRPQTLSFGLTDSPAGLAAWIVEKFRAWSDCGGNVENVFTRDQMLANISFYWFRCDRIVVLHLLFPRSPTLDDSGRRRGDGADGVRGISKGDAPPSTLAGRADVHKHLALDGHEEGRSFRGDGAGRRAR